MPYLLSERCIYRSRKERSAVCDADMKKEELIGLWQKFSEEKDFMLNPDEEHVMIVAEGVLGNEKASGLRSCPCRISDSSYEKDIELLCPCNFKTHNTWKEEDRCWCGLFIRRGKQK